MCCNGYMDKSIEINYLSQNKVLFGYLHTENEQTEVRTEIHLYAIKTSSLLNKRGCHLLDSDCNPHLQKCVPTETT